MMMNGRVSPYNTRNVKQDVAAAIVSAGLLGQFGGEYLKENSGLHPVPNKKKTVLPELPTQKKPKPPLPYSDEALTAGIVKSPSLGDKKKPLGSLDSTADSPSLTGDYNFTANQLSSTNTDLDLLADDFRPSRSQSPHSQSPHAHSTSPPTEKPSTPTLPDQHYTANSQSPSPTPQIKQTLGFTSSPGPAKTPVFGTTKKAKVPKEEAQVEIPPTKIPERYHIADQYPIRPHAIEEGEKLDFANQGWQKKWFPSDKPQGRREVLQLIRTFEAMLEDLAAPQQQQTQTQSAAPPLSDIEKEQTIYDTILHEIIRQVTVECADRGVLLEKVSRRYRRLFARVPLILSEMQQEIDGLVDANKSLRLLLERLMETKSEAETQVKETRNKILETDDVNTKLAQEIEQNKITIQKLIKERDDATEEAKRQLERHYYQEKLNSELLSKDEYNKATIRSMGKQLEDTINSLHDMEAKYLSLKTQQQAEAQKQKQAQLEAAMAEKEKKVLTVTVPEKEEPELKVKEETEPEPEPEEEEEETDRDAPRASTADGKGRGKKSPSKGLNKSSTFDSTKSKKTKGKDKDGGGKDGEDEGPQSPAPRAKTPTGTSRGKQAAQISPKPGSPSSKLRTSTRNSGRNLMASGEIPAEGEHAPT